MPARVRCSRCATESERVEEYLHERRASHGRQNAVEIGDVEEEGQNEGESGDRRDGDAPEDCQRCEARGIGALFTEMRSGVVADDGKRRSVVLYGELWPEVCGWLGLTGGGPEGRRGPWRTIPSSFRSG